jgi:two-component system OmpR family sensor kinase
MSRQSRAPWSLRRRLVLGIVSLLALSSLIIGVTSVLALQSFLTDRIDEQLAAATGRFGVAQEQPDGADVPSGRPPGPGFFAILGGTGTLVASYDDNGSLVRADVLTESADVEPLTEGQIAQLEDASTATEPITVDLGGDLGTYRLVAVDTGPGSLVIGLSMTEVQETVRQLAITIAVIAVVSILLAVLLGTRVVAVALRPLSRVAATANSVASTRLDRGEVVLAVRVPEADTDPRTEVGQVGAAINTMLSHVAQALEARQSSEQQVRQFVADASHELRTPLASIRGYAELTRRGGHELPKDVTFSMERVESEAVRMTALVEDLLLLARLDAEPTVSQSDVDLTRLVVDAVSDAHAASPDHDWQLEIPDKEILVAGEGPRLHQVVANLLANARVHTPPGTTVTVRLGRLEATRLALIEIIDDGPGISEELQPTLFQRFVRGDSSRSRDAGSTGLGLAIVQAVVIAHGGTVEVESRPGRTAFSVRLPLTEASA